MDTNNFLGIINSWQLTRLPKGFDFHYSLCKDEIRHSAKTMKEAIEYANQN